MKRHSEIERFIQTVAHAARQLEPAAYESVCRFIYQSQASCGAFCDRGGQPDLYYSFFGYLICKAFQLDQEVMQLQEYASHAPGSRQTFISCSIAAFFRYSRHPSFLTAWNASVRLTWRWIKAKDRTDQAYRSFVSMLLLNHFWGSPRYLSGILSKITHSLPIDNQLPTTHLAALLCINCQIGIKNDSLSPIIMAREHPDGGFVSFKGQPAADLLSTAAAVYSLYRAQIDTRLIRPKHLQYVASLFDQGAFLSGDGDPTRDIEYTFYGLLSLGSLS